MTGFYPILKVTPEQRIGDESLGTKEKFWFRREDGSLWLFKDVRAISQDLGFSGEDWAEKTAAEMARFLDIPAAEVELAEHEGRRGCASKSFIGSPVGQDGAGWVGSQCVIGRADLLMRPVFQVLRVGHQRASSSSAARQARLSTECARKRPASSSPTMANRPATRPARLGVSEFLCVRRE
ncbi:MAG: hypothetical protein LBI68_06980 [Azoarcus sp.]|jgi:hypothetical protein|nr:hypothetical protein [Azoarcus sp.]